MPDADRQPRRRTSGRARVAAPAAPAVSAVPGAPARRGQRVIAGLRGVQHGGDEVDEQVDEDEADRDQVTAASTSG